MTKIRPELSKKNELYIDKHAFYMAYHFALQYPEWKRIYAKLDGWPDEIGKNEGDTTSRDGIRRAQIGRNIELIEECARLVGKDILRFVTESQTVLPTELRYQYRLFFWELSKRRS